ncbi:hypothetical protein BGZ73_003086 [Actinomortierella ambigua]|nr:hypothetical protein BGZ73_003086 [Actinomortierella ambigua]
MSSLIAKDIGIDELVGSVLIGASMVLTTHSIARMVFLRRTASKFFLFPIINVSQLLNQIFVFLLVTAAIGTIGFETALWLNVLNNVAYFITKPTVMYLAYLRCSAVMPILKKGEWVHHILIGIRAIELFAIVIVNIATNIMCDGSLSKGTRCESFQIAWTVRDAGAPVFRFYVIACEGIFYYKLFGTLRGMSNGKHAKVLRYRRLQTSLFTVDLVIMTYMSIYRIIGIWNKSLPTYVYLELFSSTLTIFNLTEFGLNIRSLFGAASDGQPNTSSMNTSSANNKVEMRSIDRDTQGPGSGGANPFYQPGSLTSGADSSETRSYNRHNSSSSRRPLIPSSNSPSPASGLGGAADHSDIDLSASEAHRDYSPSYTVVVDSAPPAAATASSPSSLPSHLYSQPFAFGHPTPLTVGDDETTTTTTTAPPSAHARARSTDEPWRLTIAELIAGRDQFTTAPGGPPSHLVDPYSTLDNNPHRPKSPPSSSSSSSGSTLNSPAYPAPLPHRPSSPAVPQPHSSALLLQQQQHQQQQQAASENYIIDPISFQQQAQWASATGSGAGAGAGSSTGAKLGGAVSRTDKASTTTPSSAASPRLPSAPAVAAGGIGSARSSEDHHYQHPGSPSRPHRALVVPDRSTARRRP